MAILSLDLANSCGYAVYKGGRIVAYGVWNLCKHKRGIPKQSHIELYELLERATQKYGITKIVLEDVYFPANNKENEYKSYNAVKSLLKLQGVVALFCECYNIPYHPIGAMIAKRFMFRATNKMGRDILKKRMILAVEALGYTLPERHKDDVADAIGILCTYLNEKIKSN